MYLLDTNIWLERLLDQERADDVGRFLENIPSDQLYITDFALHSIAVIMIRLEAGDGLVHFVDDLFENHDTNLVRLEAEDTYEIIKYVKRYNLDFDDAYQYVAAVKFNLKLISFDSDFDKTERGRNTPDQYS